MMIKESTIFQQTPAKKRWIGYKPDGNTVCHHFNMAYQYKDFWIVDCGDDDYLFSIPVGKNLVPVSHESGYNNMARLEKFADLCSGMDNDNFYKHLDRFIEHGGWLKNSDIQAWREYKGDEAAVKYQNYHDMKAAEREKQGRKRQEENERKRQEEERRRREEYETEYKEFISKLKNAVKDGGTVKNDSGMFVEACDRYGIKVPIRTRGWMLNYLVSVTFEENNAISCRYMRRTKNSKGSQTCFDVLADLKKRVIAG